MWFSRMLLPTQNIVLIDTSSSTRRDDILQKRPIIFRSLLIVATSYTWISMLKQPTHGTKHRLDWHILMCQTIDNQRCVKWLTHLDWHILIDKVKMCRVNQDWRILIDKEYWLTHLHVSNDWQSWCVKRLTHLDRHISIDPSSSTSQDVSCESPSKCVDGDGSIFVDQDWHLDLSIDTCCRVNLDWHMFIDKEYWLTHLHRQVNMCAYSS